MIFPTFCSLVANSVSVYMEDSEKNEQKLCTGYDIQRNSLYVLKMYTKNLISFGTQVM